jgi:type II secretory ATPase GspE/PulE/Tfp pilus assembly ATPase PilB-like protein
MNQEKVKLIVKNMELLIQSLKKEIEDPVEYNYEEITQYINDEDVDEYYDDKEDV